MKISARSLVVVLPALLQISSATAAELTPDEMVFDPSALDRSVAPCDDFYQFACGGWLNRTELPADKARMTRSFTGLMERNTLLLREVLENYAQGGQEPAVPDAQKLGNFYSSCMNEAGLDQASGPAVSALLARVDSLTRLQGLSALVADLQLEGIEAFFSFGPTADFDHPDSMIAEVSQGGLGLPDSTYYTDTSERRQELRQKYQEHMTKIFELAGFSAADAQLQALHAMALENRIAVLSLPPDQLQDPGELYHPGTSEQLQVAMPLFDWNTYYNGISILPPSRLNIAVPAFMTGLNTILETSSLEEIRAYLRWQSLRTASSSLGLAFRNEAFRFYGQVLSGQRAELPRWKNCVGSVSGEMGEALGQAFVAKAFSPAAKQRILAMIDSIKAALQTKLQTSAWLDDATRVAAIQKLELMGRKIGYPDQWQDYSELNISADQYLANIQNATRFESRKSMQKIGGAVDRNEWYMSPQTVNAYYDPTMNQINFPAAILLAPFFSESASDASNFGAIGMVIGHEITHGFDTSGSQFDGHGALRDWWSADVKAAFEAKASCMIEQYNAFEPIPGLHVNGQLTITENIADQGGLAMTYAAYEISRQGREEEAPVAGLSSRQQLFVSMAQLWCEKRTEGSLRQQVSSDPHSPAHYRVNGPMANLPSFAETFGCSAGSPMVPATRCQVW